VLVDVVHHSTSIAVKQLIGTGGRSCIDTARTSLIIAAATVSDDKYNLLLLELHEVANTVIYHV
jgi:hypothetical protein